MLAQALAGGQLVVEGEVGFDGLAVEVYYLGCQLNVRAAPGHIGGDRNRADSAGFGDDLGLFVVVAGVE